MKYGCQSMFEKVESILIKHPRDAFISQDHLNDNWQAFDYEGVPDFKGAIQEFSRFEQIIKECVPQVHYLPVDQNVGIDSIYTHDSVKITKHGAIYFPMGKTLRGPETFAMQSYLESISIKTLGHIKGKGKMEGGDIVWLDEGTVAIGQGYRTNKEGIDQFHKLTNNFIKKIYIIPLPHAQGPAACLHLMSLISMIDHDLAVVYLKYMPVFFKEILESRGITLIDVSDEEYNRLGSNVLALSPGKFIMMQGNPEIQNKLKQLGVKVHLYPGLELSLKGTGGPTCLTQPVFRTS
jgi:arginine deiminase